MDINPSKGNSLPMNIPTAASRNPVASIMGTMPKMPAMDEEKRERWLSAMKTMEKDNQPAAMPSVPFGSAGQGNQLLEILARLRR